MNKISWFSLNNTDASGELWYSQGYFNAAINTIKALQDKKCAVYYNREDIDFHVNFCSPHYYQLRNRYKIGYTPWESTKVPNSWLYQMLQCDEIWATSSFVKEVYEKNNVHHNIHVIPHGVSPEFQIMERELKDKFVFLHVGGDSKRKNAQIVVDAFLELFDGKNDYVLILKYNKFCHAEAYVDGNLVSATNHPQIIGIPETLSTEDMVRLYHKSNCLVYPTSGEGFGLIPLEAMATGLPTILTNETGCKDFSHFGIPISSRMTTADWNNFIYADDTGEWASPDFEEILYSMQNVVNEYQIFSSSALRSAKIIHSEWSWESTADKILERLDNFTNNYL